MPRKFLNIVCAYKFHDNTNGSARGPNTITRWTQGGLRFAHFGDFGQDSITDAQLADLADIDVAFMPMNIPVIAEASVTAIGVFGGPGLSIPGASVDSFTGVMDFG